MKYIPKSISYLLMAALGFVCSPDTALAQTNTLNVSPTSLTFSSSVGTPQPQTVNVSSTSGNVPFTVSVTQGNSFIGVFPTSGTATPTSKVALSVYISNPNMAAGTYTGTVAITPMGGSAVNVSVTYTVGSNGGGGGVGPVQSTPTSLTFTSAVGGQAMSNTFTLSTTGNSINLTLTPSLTNGSGWLSLGTATTTIDSNTPATVTVTVYPGTMPSGQYNGLINVYRTNSAVPILQISVTLNIGTTGGNGKLSVSPATLTYSLPGGSTTKSSQALTVATISNVVEQISATATVSSGTGWLTVNPGAISITSSVGGQFSVTVDPSNLSTGTYNGSINLSNADLGNVSVPVTVNIGSGGGNGSELTSTPSALNFSIPVSANQSSNLNFSVSSTAQTNVTATAATNDGGSWLAVNPSTPQPVAPDTNATFTATVDPTQLPEGNRATGEITLTPDNGTNPLTVLVNVTVGGSATLMIAPAALSFGYQTGTQFPAAQSLSLTSSGQATTFSASATTSQGVNWLVVTPQTGATGASGSAPTIVSVSVNPSGLTPGIYNGTITINAPSATMATQAIPVTLLVSNLPILTLSSQNVIFNYQFGTTTLPVPQEVQITSSGNPLSFTSTITPNSGGNFLTVTPTSGTTPQTLNLSINPTVLAGLAAGTYSSTVTITPQGAGNTSVNLPVTLIVGNNTLLSASQSSLNFNYQTGKALPPSQTFSLSSSGAPINYTVSATSTDCTMNFLSASSAQQTTPGNVVVTVSTTGLTPGVCHGMLTITSSTSGVGNSPLSIPVTVTVSNSPLLNVSPGAVNVTTQVGVNPANQTIALTSTDPSTAINFNLTTATNNASGWLSVNLTSGSTPNNLSVGFQTAGLAIGTYTGSITITPTTTGGTPTTIPVSVVVTSSTTASATPTSLTFTQAPNGAQPANQTIQVTSTSSGLTFSASATTSSGGNWLSLTPTNATTPATITVSANGATLGQGSYNGNIALVIPGAANTPINIPVTLTITSQALAASPATLSFTYQAGSTTTPQAQTVNVTSTGGNVAFTATPSSTPNKLIIVTPGSGNTPGTVSVGLNQSVLSTLTAGSYTGTVTISSANLPSQTVNVTVTVHQVATTINSVVNAASNLPGPVAPNEIVSIYGTNIGPSTAVGIQITNGLVDTMLSNVEVTFDGVPAPLLYVSSGQVNAIVPQEIAGRATTNIVVQNNGQSSMSLQLSVASTSPAIFSLSQGGNGQGAILNQDSSVNGASNPATSGSVISIFATGEGQLKPQPPTGTVTSSTPPFPVPIGAVSVTIGGQTAQVLYAGEAPSLVMGVLQVNAVIPSGLGSGPQPIVLTVGSGQNLAQSITVAVK